MKPKLLVLITSARDVLTPDWIASLTLYKTPEWEAFISATPEDIHFPIAKDCLGAGKHVFLEKPLSITLAEADELVDLALQNNVKFIRSLAPHANPNMLMISMFENYLGITNKITDSLKKYPHTVTYDCETNFAPVTVLSIEELLKYKWKNL